MKQTHSIVTLSLLFLTMLSGGCSQPSPNGNTNVASPPPTPQATAQRSPAQLVQQGNFSYGDKAPQPSDRAKLLGLSTVDVNGNPVTLGEGNLVTLEAFVLDAKHDDTYVLGSGPEGYKGEGVNCNNSLFDWNDIHIALGQTALAEECSSVTAEIIRHFGPPLWDRFDMNECNSAHVRN